MTTKICKLCKKEKDISCYNKHNGTVDKLDQRCKECMKEIRQKSKEKAKKNKEKKQDEILDKFKTKTKSINWQGGKIVGNIFKRTFQNIDYICVNVGGKQKSFNIKKCGSEEKAREEAEKFLIEKNKESNLIKNQYKIIHGNNNQPKYIIVQLSKGYVMLTDYEDLELIKKHTFFVQNSSTNENAKKYCALNLNTKKSQYHKFITGYDITDHINGYPLDNRKCNLRNVTLSENNKNRTLINSVTLKKVEGGFIPEIKYNNNKLSESPLKPFKSKLEAQVWIDKQSDIIDHKISFDELETKNNVNVDFEYKRTKKKLFIKPIISIETTDGKIKKIIGEYSDNNKEVNKWINENEVEVKKEYIKSRRKQLALDFETIMKKHADGYKWHDKIDDDTEVKKDIIEDVVTDKDTKYKRFLKIDPKFDLSKLDTSKKKIKHITHKGIEYKFCSGCNKWIDVKDYFKNSKNWDELDRRCKVCKKKSKESNKI